MKKLFVFTLLLAGLATGAFAQNAGSSSQQTVQLDLSNAVEISFVNTGTSTGSLVALNFNSANDFANGVESSAQELKVRSNKSFKVGVKIDYNSFSYSGSGVVNPSNIPMNGFAMKMVSNNTGGTIASPFSTSSYAALTGTTQDVILNGTNGGDQRFQVMYKCTPGFLIPFGTYTFDLIYTATQP